MKSKLAKRNEQVHSLLNSLELDNLSGVEDVDCCDLFHHTFFLGARTPAGRLEQPRSNCGWDSTGNGGERGRIYGGGGMGVTAWS